MIRRITENLDIDVFSRVWFCHHCHYPLGNAALPYKSGCLVAARDPTEIWEPLVAEKFNFSYDPDWCQIIEFYCPRCAWLIEVDVLPPGHPIPNDIELDLDTLARTVSGEEEGEGSA